MKSGVRAGSMKGAGSAEAHAKRQDEIAKKRQVRKSKPVAWSKGPGPLDYVEALKAHMIEMRAEARKNAAQAIEFKCVVSPEWLAETGDPRSAENPRVLQLVDEAKRWAESWGGKGAVWAVRYDTDERGSGVVDVFMSPVREQRHKSGKTKQVISCRKAKNELLEKERDGGVYVRNSGVAMQNSWARWCQHRLDPRLERGVSREQTNRDHLHADIFAEVAEKARAEALQAVQAEVAAMIETAQAEAKEITQAARDRAADVTSAAHKKGLDRAHDAATACFDEAQSQAARIISNAVEKARKIGPDTIGRQAQIALEVLRDTVRALVSEDGFRTIMAEAQRRWERHPERLRPDLEFPPQYPGEKPVDMAQFRPFDDPDEDFGIDPNDEQPAPRYSGPSGP